MGKRSDFARLARDYYPTIDPRAGAALAPFLPPESRYVEPCAGDGALIRQLGPLGHRCVAALDVEPNGPGIQRGDALRLRNIGAAFDLIITNPPFKRDVLAPLIPALLRLGRPVWLLLPSDWAFTAWAAPLLDGADAIVAIGRLRWMEGTSDDGKENHAWYRFAPGHSGGPRFYAKGARP